MESIKDKVAVVGMGCTQFGELWTKSPEDLIVEACQEAFEDAGLTAADIQAAWFASLVSGCTGSRLAAALKLDYVPVTRVENFCCGGLDAFRNACYGVASGAFDLVLAVGVEKLKDHSGGFGQFITAPLDSSKVEVDLPPVNFFAQFATRYFHRYGIPLEEGKQGPPPPGDHRGAGPELAHHLLPPGPFRLLRPERRCGGGHSDPARDRPGNDR